MSFQILDTNNEPIAINTLDEQAAALWGKPVDKKSYASPSDEPGPNATMKELLNSIRDNWFDTIGWQIHDGITTWDELEKRILAPYVEFPTEEVMAHKSIGGFVNLIRHWKSLGYTPKQVTE